MRLLLKAIAIVGCVTAASAAQAVPLFYDEADSGDIFARIGAIPVVNFVVPENSVLSFVTVEFGAFEFTGPLVGFGPNYSIRRGGLTGPSQGVATSRSSRCWVSACSHSSSEGQARVLTTDSKTTCSRSSHRRPTCTRESRGATSAAAARARAIDN